MDREMHRKQEGGTLSVVVFFGLVAWKDMLYLKAGAADCSSVSLSWQAFTPVSDSRVLLINRMVKI